jgi:ribosome-binding factor A
MSDKANGDAGRFEHGKTYGSGHQQRAARGARDGNRAVAGCGLTGRVFDLRHPTPPPSTVKKHTQRAQRVGDQIQRELAQLLRDEVKDPRVGRVTITEIEVSPDLSHAKVFFTHLAGREHAAEVVEALQHTAGFLRTALSHRLNLYSVPQLHFTYDDSIESGMRLSQIIDEAVAADRKLPPE